MSSDVYVRKIISKYRVPSEVDSQTQYYVVNPLGEMIKAWAGDCLNDIQISGSRAKGTAINISSDLDLFISLKSTTNNTLKEIYDSLYNYISNKGISCRKQNVSIGINYGGHSIDLVPGKKHSGNTNDHSLYRNKKNTWTQTNIHKHITQVKNSGRLEEIILLKTWRKLHNLDFPSIYLELVAIEALTYKNKNQPATNFLSILDYLKDSFVDKTIMDPANTNNVISDDLYKYEKENIAKKAKESRNQEYWEKIIW
ncbi:hypothetical protein [Bacteroides sp.]|uniref:hypothetical protein n=1 Tax=Bacteroides sp. TaxID=29523 RepID=UPI00262E4086|nr:hypothetical protein [Bacteroides sp.]MDD3041003.1 hypothetical protein [Bacteroides sp.]